MGAFFFPSPLRLLKTGANAQLLSPARKARFVVGASNVLCCAQAEFVAVG